MKIIAQEEIDLIVKAEVEIKAEIEVEKREMIKRIMIIIKVLIKNIKMTIKVGDRILKQI